MATSEHKELANIIKTVHQQLREKVLRGEASPEKIWKDHLDSQDLLNNYAHSMQKLATEFWLDTEQSRITWVANEIETYFFNGGLQRELNKDRRRADKLSRNIPEVGHIVIDDLLKVLDVGSCYNPFNSFPSLDVTPIDIAPANSSVFKCDFLGVPLGVRNVLDINSSNYIQTVKCLAEASFNVVIFCLLLEYLPTPEQRLECVIKAVSLLSDQGILCIVTPDSCHQGRNSTQLRAWKTGLELLGLSKVTYEKSRHFHGLVYRKPSPDQRELIKIETRRSIDDQSPDLSKVFYIPQDISTCVVEEEVELEMSEEDRETLKESFTELPLMEIY